MYTRPSLPPEATSATGPFAQLKRPCTAGAYENTNCVRGAPTSRERAVLYLFILTAPLSKPETTSRKVGQVGSQMSLFRERKTNSSEAGKSTALHYFTHLLRTSPTHLLLKPPSSSRSCRSLDPPKSSLTTTSVIPLFHLRPVPPLPGLQFFIINRAWWLC
jgi:hypothetical protein